VSVLVTLAVAVPTVLGAAAPAYATTTQTGTFVYTGQTTDSKTIIDTHLQYVDGCSDALIFTDDPTLCEPDFFPGTLWFRAQAGVDFTVVDAQTADFNLSGPDSFRQDTTAPFSTTLTVKDAAGEEVHVKASPWFNVDAAYDAPPANCSKDTITTDDELTAADTNGCLNLVVHSGKTYIGDFNIFAKSLQLPYSGSADATDTKSSPELDVGALVGVPGIVKVRLDVDVKTTLTATDGFHADRTISASSDPGTPLASGQISWPSANPVDDNVHVPCSAPVGDNLVYKLANNKWDGTGKVDATPKIVIVTPVGDIDVPLGFSVNLFNDPVSVTAAPDFTAVLGEVQAENKPPVIGAISAPSGNEGSPITFGATATDNCGTPTIRWDFSDGGVAFGPNVQHTFADNGIYSGLVTATDGAGNVATKAFSVNVSNLAPSVNAGPDTGSAWGRIVAFNGQATDPGSADQSTLQYTWNFGDGTPSASGGPSVVHSYATPNTYTATLTVCDKDGLCASDTRDIVVSKRAATLVYQGDKNGGPNKYANLSSTLTDQFGQAVVGASVGYTLGPQATSATSNGAGVAATTLRITSKPGSYPLAASFTGNSLYTGSSVTGLTYSVGK
jgi:hypothetical protein